MVMQIKLIVVVVVVILESEKTLGTRLPSLSPRFSWSKKYIKYMRIVVKTKWWMLRNFVKMGTD